MSALQTLAERVAAGEQVTDSDARVLLESRDLIAVGALADDARRRAHGTSTTFVRVYEIRVDAVPASLPSSLAAGEIRIVGTPASLEAAVAAASAIRKMAPAVPLTGFSLADLPRLGAVGDVAAGLRGAGLDAVAEVPLDAVDAVGHVEEVRAAGLSAFRLTVTTYDGTAPSGLVRRASEIQSAVGDFRAFAPLPRTVSPVTPTTGYDDVKLVAMARLLALNIPSIQVDWPLYGPKLAQVALLMGADDVDGVAAYDPATLGVRRSALAEITGNIRAASLEPVERNGRFERVA